MKQSGGSPSEGGALSVNAFAGAPGCVARLPRFPRLCCPVGGSGMDRGGCGREIRGAMRMGGGMPPTLLDSGMCVYWGVCTM